MAALNSAGLVDVFEMLLAVSRLLPEGHQLDFAVSPHCIHLHLIGRAGEDVATSLHELDGRPEQVQEMQDSLAGLLRKVAAPEKLSPQSGLQSVMAGLQAWVDDDKLPAAFRHKAGLMLAGVRELNAKS